MPEGTAEASRLSARWQTEPTKVVSLLAELVAARSVNPPGDERAVAGVIARAAARMGLPAARLYARSAERPNLVLDIGRGDPVLVLAAHMDTVPEEASAPWEHDPLRLRERDGKLIGLGAADMKASIASMLVAAMAVAQDPPASGTLRLVFTADEENGSDAGMAWLAAEGFLEADAAVVTEPSSITDESWDALYVAQRGSCVVELVARGRPGHSGEQVSQDERAGTLFARALNAIAEATPLDDFIHPIDGSRPLVNLATTVRGGETAFAHPEVLKATIEVRTIAGMSQDDVLVGLRGVLRPLGANGRLSIEPRSELSWIPPGEILTDESLIAAAEEAWIEVLGRRPGHAVFPAGTDSSYLDQLGVPTLSAFGPGTLLSAHRPGESVRREEVGLAVQMFERLARNYFRKVHGPQEHDPGGGIA